MPFWTRAATADLRAPREGPEGPRVESRRAAAAAAPMKASCSRTGAFFVKSGRWSVGCGEEGGGPKTDGDEGKGKG